MKIFEGNLVSQDIKVGIVCARFNEFIVSKLLSGCEDGLLRHGVKPDDISVAWVPAPLRSPSSLPRWPRAESMTRSSPWERSSGAAPVTTTMCATRCPRALPPWPWRADIPVMFGVLTTDTIEQAIERAGTKAGNKVLSALRGPLRWST